MSDEKVVRHCAPTLANLKTANLFTCRFDSDEEMRDGIRSLNARLGRKGVRALPLRWREGTALIYVYRPKRLSTDLENELAQGLLRSCGYDCRGENQCIACLRRRLADAGETFPHEIGLFLGYPPEDVDGFIHRRDEYTCCGYWKVYGDAESARKKFALLRKCSDIYMRMWSQGRDIERLTVACPGA